jgi:hypothetical protein
VDKFTIVQAYHKKYIICIVQKDYLPLLAQLYYCQLFTILQNITIIYKAIDMKYKHTQIYTNANKFTALKCQVWVD